MKLTSRTQILGVAGLLMVAMTQNAQATVIVDASEVVGGVTLEAFGTLDLTGLTNFGFSSAYPQVIPGQGYLVLGNPPSHFTQIYRGLTGPTTFGGGGQTLATSGAGSPGLFAITNFGQWLSVSNGFFGGPVSTSSFFSGATFASLGMTPGEYTWSWSNDSVTLRIPDVSGGTAPEPTTCALLAIGVLGLHFRRRTFY